MILTGKVVDSWGYWRAQKLTMPEELNS